MRCYHCEAPMGGLFGLLRARGVECSNEDCGEVYCVSCLPELANSFEEGIGPFRHGVLELRCLACETVLRRTEFRPEWEMSARDALQRGLGRVQQKLAEHGVRTLLKANRRNRRPRGDDSEPSSST